MRTLPQPHVARRTLFVAMAILLISPVVGSFLIDNCPLSARDPEATDTINRWHAHPTAPDILPSSAVRPRALHRHGRDDLASAPNGRRSNPQIFNAALPAGDPILLKFLAEHLLDHGAAPRLVLLEANLDTSARRNVFFDSAITRQFTMRDIVSTSMTSCTPPRKPSLDFSRRA